MAVPGVAPVCAERWVEPMSVVTTQGWEGRTSGLWTIPASLTNEVPHSHTEGPVANASASHHNCVHYKRGRPAR